MAERGGKAMRDSRVAVAAGDCGLLIGTSVHGADKAAALTDKQMERPPLSTKNGAVEISVAPRDGIGGVPRTDPHQSDLTPGNLPSGAATCFSRGDGRW